MNWAFPNIRKKDDNVGDGSNGKENKGNKGSGKGSKLASSSAKGFLGV